MGIHYDSKAGVNCRRKSLSAVANNIVAENNQGVNQIYFKNRFVQDAYHTISFFAKVCKHIGNLSDKEITKMVKKLKEDEQCHKVGNFYYFDDEKMYTLLISHPICKKVCEKQKYDNWNDIIQRFC